MSFRPLWWLVAGAVLVLVVALLTDWPRRRRRGGGWVLARHLGVALLLVGIGLRPLWGERVAEHSSIDADIIIVVDRTASMGAVDVDGRTRAQAVAADVTRMTSALAGARFSVVSFDDAARVELPSTSDAAAVSTTVSALGWQEAQGGHGSDIAVAVPVVRKELERVQRMNPGARRLVFYFGDGEQTARRSPESFAPVAPLVQRAVVVGYGTTTGASMRRSPANADPVRVGGTIARSRADPGNLERIASELHGTFRQGPLGDWFATMRPELSTVTHEDSEETGGHELAPWLAVGVQVLVLLDVFEQVLRWRRARQERKP